MRNFGARTLMMIILVGFTAGLLAAAENANPQQPQSQTQSQDQQVTSFYQGNDGGYVLVINNDLSPASISVNTPQYTTIFPEPHWRLVKIRKR